MFDRGASKEEWARFILPHDFADAGVLGAEATADYCYSHQDFCDAD